MINDESFSLFLKTIICVSASEEIFLVPCVPCPGPLTAWQGCYWCLFFLCFFSINNIFLSPNIPLFSGWVITLSWATADTRTRSTVRTTRTGRETMRWIFTTKTMNNNKCLKTEIYSFPPETRERWNNWIISLLMRCYVLSLCHHYPGTLHLAWCWRDPFQ